jgi:hypothetical protein
MTAAILNTLLTKPGARGLACHGWTEEQAAMFVDQCRAAGFTNARVETYMPGRKPRLIVRATKP